MSEQNQLVVIIEQIDETPVISLTRLAALLNYTRPDNLLRRIKTMLPTVLEQALFKEGLVYRPQGGRVTVREPHFTRSQADAIAMVTDSKNANVRLRILADAYAKPSEVPVKKIGRQPDIAINPHELLCLPGVKDDETITSRVAEGRGKVTVQFSDYENSDFALDRAQAARMKAALASGKHKRKIA